MDVVLPSSTEQRVVVIDIIQMRFVCYTPEEEEKKTATQQSRLKLCAALSPRFICWMYIYYII
jgi:hypothetical protein